MPNRPIMVFSGAMFIMLLLLQIVAAPVSASERFDQQELLNVRYDRVNQLLRAGRLDQAMKQALKALEMAKGLYGAASVGTAPAIDRVAAVYRAMGRLQDAEVQLRLALDIIRKDSGDNQGYTVSALNNLAGLYKEMGRYTESEKFYLQAIELQKKLPENTAAESDLLSNLSVLYILNTRYADAEPLLKKVLTLAEKAAERDWLTEKMKISTDRQQVEVARCRLNLANLYFKMKRYADSEAMAVRTLEAFKRILGEEHPEVARVKGDLGVLYTATGEYAKAEKLLAEAINTAVRVYGDKPQPVVAEYYTSLAHLYEKNGNYTEALRFARHGQNILMGTLGKSNPKTLRSLNNIAVIHTNLGNMKQAEQILRDVLDTAKKLMGEKHESLATNMSNLGSVLAAQGKHSEANRLFAEAIAINEQKRENAFLILSEQQKLNYVSDMLLQVQLYISHLSQHGPFGSKSAETAMDTWLRWKGAVMEAQGRYVDALYRSDNPLLQQRFDELAQVKRELAAKLLFMKRDNDGARQHDGAADGLEARKQSLEAELSGLSRQYSQDMISGKIDIHKLAGLLPLDAVYIDFAEISMIDFSLHLSENKRYVAFVLVPGDSVPVRLVDIGDRDALDALLREYLKEMRKKAEAHPGHDSRRLDAYASQLFELVLKPLLPHVKGRANLFVSPDGALNLMPLEVLLNSKGRYVAEDFRVNYVASGRDMLRSAAPTGIQSGPAVVVSDPDFDMQMPVMTGQTSSGGIFKSIRFDRLPDTKQEADSIIKLLSSANVQVSSYQGKQADEQALFTARNPRILHLATHGYFLKGDIRSGANTRGLKVSLKTDLNQDTAGVWIENPMLRSGIVLAGANSSLKQGSDQGMVSAEKILGLRLRGTDLVTLSACETAMGDVRAGEGVFGLKRAFLLSGAKTLVMSLWSVPSVETAELMTDFYTLMHRGIAKGQALRQAKLNMMKKNRHPFYWGAFVMVGKPD